jgi:hypothetical protein
MSNYNQHSPSIWARTKRKRVAEIKARKAAENKLVLDVIGIAAQYIETKYLIEFTNEVRARLDEHDNKELET